MTTLKLTKTFSGSFKPVVGLGSTARLTAKRHYPSWRHSMTGLITAATVLTVLGVVVIASIA